MKHIKLGIKNGHLYSDIDVNGLTLSENGLLIRALEELKLKLLEFEYKEELEIIKDEDDEP